ncbi:MAG TPA: S9 family peptidase [Bacteroidales bacterium]|nr:S9 family peptidase [Bacteroidales bacterium]
MNHSTRFFILFAFISTFYLSISAQSKLTIDQIMQEPTWMGISPDNVFWSKNSDIIYFNWRKTTDVSTSLYSYGVKNNKIEKVSEKESSYILNNHEVFFNDKSKKISVSGGTIILYDLKLNTEKRIISFVKPIYNIEISKNDKKVYFAMENNWYAYTLAEGTLKQITNFIFEDAPFESSTSQKMNLDNALENDQLYLFDFFKEKKAKPQTDIEEIETLKPLYLGSLQLINSQICPNENFILYTVYKSNETKDTKVPLWITKSGYVESTNARPKVGYDDGTVMLGIIDLKLDSTYWIKTDQLPGINDLPKFYSEYPNAPKQINRKTNAVFSGFSATGEALIVLNGSDNKDRWIALLDLKTGIPKVLDWQHDEAWIGGPGIDSYFSGGNVGWMPDQKSVWYQSEADGFSHIYTVNTATLNKTQLTKGKFEIYEPQISTNKKWWYFSSNEVHSGERNFYKMPISGGKRTKLTSLTGGNECFLSPDETKIAILYSFANTPPELYISEVAENAIPKKITDSQSTEFKAYPWRVPDFISFKATDNAMVPARLYKPDKEIANGAAVIFVHGAGYLQNAHKWWSTYYREYLFHNLLVDMGYTVLDIDYRGSSGYGRNWRTAIYRHMGGKDLSDQIDGAKILANEHGIKADKIGIYGGSYGGFITLMALFTSPETFACGAALRSVTDWAHYNHGYTSNILNTPELDSIAFRRSSPIFYAEGLKKPLLILHGMVDTNVHLQDVIRLSQRLIELKKENWEMALYPVEDHGFKTPTSWTDEYKRILNLFENNLRN